MDPVVWSNGWRVFQRVTVRSAFEYTDSTLVVIRQQQLDAFQKDADDRFAKRYCEPIRQRIVPRADHISNEVMAKGIVALLHSAKAYGLSADRDLVAYVCLALGVGRYFDRYPRFKRSLMDQYLPGSIKMSRLFSAATVEDWNVAAGMTAQD